MKKFLSLFLPLALCTGLAVPALAVDAHVSLSSLEYVKSSDGTVVIKDCAEGARGTLEIPDTIDGGTVISLANGAFRGCDQITQVTIPDTVTYIGEYTFSGCDSLTGIIIPDSVTKMGMCAFSECENLESAVVGKGLTTLPFGCFSKCTNLSNVTLQSGLEDIGMECFSNCPALTAVTIPNTVKTLGDSCFYRTGLTEVDIPAGVEEIDQSFFYCENLKKVTLREGLKTLGGYAFAHTALESVVIPDSVTSLSSGAFSDITTLKTVTIGSGVADLIGPIFRSNTSLETVIIRDGVQTIGAKSVKYSGYVPFNGCSSIKTLYLPGSLIEIGATTFKDSIGIQDVYYSGTAYGWGGVAVGKDNGNLLEDSVTMHYVPFSDVKAGEYYYDPMVWAIDASITNGTSETAFSPEETCTQAQIITFLYRAAGSPAVSGGSAYTNSTVTADKYYYNAMLWAYQQSVVTDIGLNPDASCTRADVVTYLWRLKDKPAATAAGFADVPSGASYAQAVNWAVAAGVTNGISETTFSPGDTCTRAQIVTFLYRAFV